MSKIADCVIEIEGRKITIDVEQDETILDAALRNGLDTPYSCMSGACNSCQAKLISGKVEMEITDALSEDEIESGEILTCQARPKTSFIEVKYNS